MQMSKKVLGNYFNEHTLAYDQGENRDYVRSREREKEGFGHCVVGTRINFERQSTGNKIEN